MRDGFPCIDDLLLELVQEGIILLWIWLVVVLVLLLLVLSLVGVEVVVLAHFVLVYISDIS